jgi:succinate dehydrogenase hydrophobic anchor subunit
VRPSPADAAVEEDERAPARAAEATDVGAGASQDDGDARGAAAAPARAGRERRWGRVAALVSLLYVAWYVIGLVVLQRSPGAYNALNRFSGGVGMRILLCGVLLAVLYHLLDGLRVTALDAIPRLAPHEVVLRTTVRFLLLAAWIPASVAVLWPAIRTWFSR